MMRKIVSLLLMMILAVSAVSLSACKKTDNAPAEKAASAVENAGSIPEGAAPISTNKDGNPTGYSKLDKDDNGRVTRDYTYDSLGNLKGSIGYEYDENDFVVKEIHYSADGSVTSQVLFERDENGSETKRTETDANGSVKTVVVTEYDEDGSMTRTQYDADGNVME